MKIREMLTVWGFDVDTQELEKTEKKLKSVQDAAGKVFAVSSAAIAGMVGVSAVAYDNIIDSLTITNVKGQEFIDTQEDMLDMTLMLSDKVNTFATGVSESFYGGISSGAALMSDQFNALTETALMFGKVVKMDTGAAIESLSDVTQGLGKDLTEVDTVANGLFLTSKQAATNVPQLVEAFRDAGPVTNALNRTFNETMAILAGLAQAGKKGSQAGTAFRSVMTKLAAPNAKAKESLDALGVSLFDNEGNLKNMIGIIEDLQIATKDMSAEDTTQLFKSLAGEEGFATLSLLMKANTDQMRQWENETKEAGNVLEEAFDKKMNSPIEQMKKLLIGITNIGIAVGRHFIPPLVAGLKVVNSLIGGVVKFLTENKAIAAIIALWFVLLNGISAAILGVILWKKAVLGLTAVTKALGIASNVVLLKWIAIGLVAAAAIMVILFALNDLYHFLTGKGPSILQQFVDDWHLLWGENLGTIEYFIKSAGDMFISFVTNLKNIFQSLGTIMDAPFLSIQTILLSISSFIVDTLMIQFERFARVGNSILNAFGAGMSDKEIGVLFKGLNENGLKGFIDESLSSVNAERISTASINRIGSAYSNINAGRTPVPLSTNSSTIESVQIQVDGSKNPIATGQAIKTALGDLTKKSNNDFKTQVVY